MDETAVLNQTEFELKSKKKRSRKVGDKKGRYVFIVYVCESMLLICLLTG